MKIITKIFSGGIPELGAKTLPRAIHTHTYYDEQASSFQIRTYAKQRISVIASNSEAISNAQISFLMRKSYK